MNPDFIDIFKSFYYSNTYLPSIDLNDNELSKNLFRLKNPEEADKIQKLISSKKIQKVLSKPLSYEPETVQKKNNALTSRGFNLLSRKLIRNTYGQYEKKPFYSVIEHPEFPNWIIKSGASRIPKNQFIIGPSNDKNEMAFFQEEESLMRVKMAQRIAKTAGEIGLKVIIPQKMFVAYLNSEEITDPKRKYCVICEKVNILSSDETVKYIKNMQQIEQKKLAKKISRLIQRAGIVDATFHNIRLCKNGDVAIIDTEPGGAMVAKKTGFLNHVFGVKGSSVEKCARIGLFNLMRQTTKRVRGSHQVRSKLKTFHDIVKKRYEKVSIPKLSKWKIALSAISLGVIPLINAIFAYIKFNLASNALKKMQKLDQEFGWNILLESGEKKKRMTQNYLAKRTPLAKQFYYWLEGVPKLS